MLLLEDLSSCLDYGSLKNCITWELFSIVRYVVLLISITKIVV